MSYFTKNITSSLRTPRGTACHTDQNERACLRSKLRLITLWTVINRHQFKLQSLQVSISTVKYTKTGPACFIDFIIVP